MALAVMSESEGGRMICECPYHEFMRAKERGAVKFAPARMQWEAALPSGTHGASPALYGALLRGAIQGCLADVSVEVAVRP
jgi:hypothetical protein